MVMSVEFESKILTNNSDDEDIGFDKKSLQSDES